MRTAIILAAGKGVRMKSDLPKVFHNLRGKPLLSHVLQRVDEIGFDRVYVVVGYRAELLKEHYKDRDIVFVDQVEQLGTAHAVMQVVPHIRGMDADILVLAGDMPLISSKTLMGLIEFHKSSNAAATVLVSDLKDPFGYGRIIGDEEGRVIRIVEEKDATDEEKKIRRVNTGIYCFRCGDLLDSIGEVSSENAQKEFYLTDTMAILSRRNRPVYSFPTENQYEAMGVNSKEQLEQLEELIRRGVIKINE